MARKKKTDIEAIAVENVRSSSTSDLAIPETRTEGFLANIAGLNASVPDGEYTRIERYLKAIADKEGSIESAQLPIITKQPEDVYLEIYSGATYSATMSVEVAGVGPFTYQWQTKRPADADWSDSSLSGNKTRTVTVVSGAASREGFQFRCKVTNANGTVYSDPATINPYRSFASPFGENTDYSVGDYCTRRGTLYRCTKAGGHSAGAWVDSDFTAVSVGGDIVNYLPTLFAPAGFGLGGESVDIPTGSDLNNYQNTGFYAWSASASLSNSPAVGTIPGFMFVQKWRPSATANSCIQVATLFETSNSPNVSIYVRGMRGGVWGSWSLLFNQT